MFIFAVTCANAVTMVDMVGIVPAFGAITMAFQNEDPTLVNMILTIPTLFMVIFSVIAGKLSAYISKKTLLMLGIVIFTIGGFLPYFSEDLMTILALRALCGVGAGFVLPTYSSLISDFFDGFERIKVLGLSNASGNIILIILSLIGGVIAAVNWHNIFFVYLVGIVLLLLAVFNIPKTAPDKKKAVPVMPAGQPAGGAGAPKVSKAVFILMVCCFLSLSFAFICSVLGSPFVMSIGLGDPSFLGICSAVMTIAQIVVGFVFSPYVKALKRFALTVGFIVYAAGYFLFATAQSQPQLIAAFTVIGVAIGMVIPYLITTATALGIKVPTQQTFIIGLITGSMFLGQFCSVFFIALLTRVLGTPDTRSIFLAVGILLVVFAVVTAINNIVKKNKPFELADAMQAPPPMPEEQA
jgi:MFS family permease